MTKRSLLFLLLFFVFGCSPLYVSEIQTETIAISSEVTPDEEIDQIIAPYRDDLKKEMDEVIGHALNDFIVERPCGNLNNWVADATLHQVLGKHDFDAPVFCLLNKGGIRTTINKGDVTIGDIFKVMPFDNEVVAAKYDASVIQKIEEYLKNSGGEPIAGAKLEAGRMKLDPVKSNGEYVWIVTSDYLFNGGDKMTFFEQPVEKKFFDLLLRDALIQEVKLQGDLVNDTTNRIQF